MLGWLCGPMPRTSLVAFRLYGTAWVSHFWPGQESIALSEELLDRGSHSAPKWGRRGQEGRGLACRVLVHQAVEVRLQSTLPPHLLGRPFKLIVPPYFCSWKHPHSPLVDWEGGNGKADAYVWGQHPTPCLWLFPFQSSAESERTERDAIRLANEMQAEYWSVSAKTGQLTNRKAAQQIQEGMAPPCPPILSGRSRWAPRVTQPPLLL